MKLLALAAGCLLLAGCATRVPAPTVVGDPSGRLADIAAPADSVHQAILSMLPERGFPIDEDFSSGTLVVTGYRSEGDSLADGRRIRAQARVLPLGERRARLWLLLIEAAEEEHLPERTLPPGDSAYQPLLLAIAERSRQSITP